MRRVSARRSARSPGARRRRLDSNDYMQIRNTLVVLTALQGCFPILAKVVAAFERRVDKLVRRRTCSLVPLC